MVSAASAAGSTSWRLIRTALVVFLTNTRTSSFLSHSAPIPSKIVLHTVSMNSFAVPIASSGSDSIASSIRMTWR
jgi:hypothetical protein